MLLFPRVYVKSISPLCPGLVKRRAFYSTCHNQSDAKQTTKKKFKELPSCFLLPDGSPAEPLSEWGSKPKHQIAPSNSLSTTPTYDANEIPLPHVKVELSNGKVRKITTRRNKPTVEENPSSKSPPKRKAGRPRSALNTDLSEESVTCSSSADLLGTYTQPRNILAKEILQNLEKFPHCLLLTRVGQFYESYFDQAAEIANLLNIKLTSRKWDGRRVSMCGFPLAHLDRYLKILVQKNNRFVAMCEEFPCHTTFKVKEFSRRVVRIITPGTLIDESFLNPNENNFLLAINTTIDLPTINSKPIKKNQEHVGLAWMDVSTGEFFSKSCLATSLQDELARIKPREVVVNKLLQTHISHPVLATLAEEEILVSYASPSKPTVTQDHDNPAKLIAGKTDSLLASGSIQRRANDSNVNDTLAPTPVPLTREETDAINLLTSYLHENLLEHMPELHSPCREGQQCMQIDSHTIKALEIREGLYEGGPKGSLLSVMKRTTTTGGTRLLTRWLCSPSTSVVEINRRQSLVALFIERPHFRADLTHALSHADDTERIVQKFLLGRGETSDLLALGKTIDIWSAISDRVAQERGMETTERSQFRPEDWDSIETLISNMTDLTDLSTIIKNALECSISESLETSPSGTAENGDVISENSANLINPTLWKYGYGKWVIKQSFSDKVDVLHTTLQKHLKAKDRLETDYQLRYDAPSLTLRSSPSQGMHVHLSKAKRDRNKLNNNPSFVPIYETGSTKCYFNQEWSQLGNLITETTSTLILAEKEAFELLRNTVKTHTDLIRRNARVLDELDVCSSFAKLATELNLVRPELTDDKSYRVVNGRHPAVELGLLSAGRVFTPNSVHMSPKSILHVITGPNMAGKSTFLRQTALIAILAQAGSFVPADSATIGIVDKLFSRIGAKDDLFRDRSTFMVEMIETADILRRATSRSLVIMDEVGRGTTVKDGLAIAYATVHHLVTTNQCRSLFATHYHELSDMLGFSGQSDRQGVFQNVGFYCTDVNEVTDDYFAYSYRLRPGVNRDSHGLKVAQLAGLPPMAMEVATRTLSLLKEQKSGTN